MRPQLHPVPENDPFVRGIQMHMPSYPGHSLHGDPALKQAEPYETAHSVSQGTQKQDGPGPARGGIGGSIHHTICSMRWLTYSRNPAGIRHSFRRGGDGLPPRSRQVFRRREASPFSSSGSNNSPFQPRRIRQAEPQRPETRQKHPAASASLTTAPNGSTRLGRTKTSARLYQAARRSPSSQPVKWR